MQVLGYQLIRSKRKTISLQITRELQVIVRCPNRTSKAEADRFVERHKDWIRRHMAGMTEAASRRAAFAFENGQTVYFLGKEYPIRIYGENKEAALSGETVLLPETEIAGRKEALLRFYLRQAEALLPELTAAWTERTELAPSKISVTRARARWGSCSGKGSLCFSYRIMLLPPELLEYVVVHELCHLRHHNHSAEFHAMVESFLPNQKQRRKWLREFGQGLAY